MYQSHIWPACPRKKRVMGKQNSTDTQRKRVSRNGGFPRAQTMCTESYPLLPHSHGWTLQPNSRSPTLGMPWVGTQWDKQDVKVFLIDLWDDWCHCHTCFLCFSGIPRDRAASSSSVQMLGPSSSHLYSTPLKKFSKIPSSPTSAFPKYYS